MKKVITSAEIKSCPTCKCAFSFEAEDVRNEHGWLYGDRKFVTCPICGETIYLY